MSSVATMVAGIALASSTSVRFAKAQSARGVTVLPLLRLEFVICACNHEARDISELA
jgi:hypothetical protein